MEGPEYHRQTEEMAAAWWRHGVACEVMDMPGLHHFSIVAQLVIRRGGRIRLIATIEDPPVIRQILAHLRLPTEAPASRSPPARAANLFSDIPT